MSDVDTAGLRKMYEAATPGEWIVKTDAGLKVAGPIKSNEKRDIVCLFPLLPREASVGTNEQNAALIVALHEAAPKLLEEIERGRRIEATVKELAAFARAYRAAERQWYGPECAYAEVAATGAVLDAALAAVKAREETK